VVPAAYVLLLREVEGQVQLLLQLRRNTGYYDDYWATAAAGHVEAGESVLEAALREAAEELGVVIEPDDLEPLTVMHRTGGNGLPIDERVDFFFASRRWSGEPTIIEPEKCAGLDWYGLDALPSPVVPHELVVIDAVAHSRDLPLITPYGFAT
jgi:8-oxo-dGTP pyrophosphatase MutT (NUDIX family)